MGKRGGVERINMILVGDSKEVLKTLKDNSIQTCVTSPPYYGLRDYGHAGQIGLEETPEQYIARLVDVFREVRRVLRDDGTLWLNLGDSYNGSGKGGDKIGNEGKQTTNAGSITVKNKAMRLDELKPKDLLMIPARVALALQADGWYLRSEIIWHKPNPMPESVKDRPTKAHEMIYLLAKSGKTTIWKSRDTLEWSYSPDLSEKIERQEGDFVNRWMGYDYYYDADAVLEPYTKPLDRWAGDELKADGKSDWDKGTGQSTYRNRNMRPNPNGRNRRDVWTVTTKPYKGAHFATFPPDLIEPCILAGSRKGDTVLDPFGGSGTTGYVAKKHERKYVIIDINPNYAELARQRVGA